MKLLLTIILIIYSCCFFVKSESDYNYFKFIDEKCSISQVVQLGKCIDVKVNSTAPEGCNAGSLDIVYYGENKFTLESFSDDKCSPKASSSINFTCTEEGTIQTIGDYSFSCYAEDPTIPKYSFFSVLQHRCGDETDMDLDKCYFMNNTEKPQCVGSIDIQHVFNDLYNFDVYIGNNCSQTPFRIGQFNCTSDGETVEAPGKNFNVTCYTSNPFNSSSILSVSSIFNLLLLISILFIF